MPASSEPDIVVIGGGPVGCATALSFARCGLRVWVVEQAPDACSRRFAGEWLHPVGATALKDLADWSTLPFPHAELPGFLVSAPGQEPVRLPYPDEGLAAGFEHADLVTALRGRLRDWANIQWLAPARARIDGNVVEIRGVISKRVRPERIVIAAGRAAVRLLGLPKARSVSLMGGIVVDLAPRDMPTHAQVILGGPGPILIYPIGARRVRVSIDLPVSLRPLSRRPELLAELIDPLLPPAIRQPTRQALLSGNTIWAAASYRPRHSYGTADVTVVGDAAGTVHPLTAAGLTLGFLDAATIGSLPFPQWRRQRLDQTLVPEWLSVALYDVFSGQAPGAVRLRDGVFAHWRRSSAMRALTTRLLAVEETRPAAFAHAFATIGLGTLVATLPEAASARRDASAVTSLLPWARWPIAAVLPSGIIARRRPLSTPQAPLKLDLYEKGRTPMSPTDDHRYCQKALEAVSRTFSQPIRMLNEPLQTGVCCGYLLCRVADTIEDHPELAAEQRNRLFPLFLATVAGEIQPQVFAAAFPLEDDRDPEIDLVRNLGRVFRRLGTIPAAQQDTIRHWVAEMARGMHIYTQRRADERGLLTLLTMQDLERYCYFVAGTVGHMLTELFCASHPDIDEESRQRLTELAESFGMGLQLVNMIKDVADDLQRGVVFVPRSLCARAGLKPSQLLDPALRARARAAVEPMFERAWAMLDDAVEYTCTLPDDALDQRLFCLLPLLMAGATLAHAEDHPALFVPGTPVKIGRADVAALIAEARSIALHANEIRETWARLRVGSTERRAS